MARGGRLKIGDTAGCNPALRGVRNCGLLGDGKARQGNVPMCLQKAAPQLRFCEPVRVTCEPRAIVYFAARSQRPEIGYRVCVSKFIGNRSSESYSPKGGLVDGDIVEEVVGVVN